MVYRVVSYDIGESCSVHDEVLSPDGDEDELLTEVD